MHYKASKDNFVNLIYALFLSIYFESVDLRVFLPRPAPQKKMRPRPSLDPWMQPHGLDLDIDYQDFDSEGCLDQDLDLDFGIDVEGYYVQI